KVRDAVVGALGFRKRAGEGEWTDEEQQVLMGLTAQLEVALESARLYQDTQRRAAQEQLIGEVTARMRESLDTDTVLRTAISEMGEALELFDVEVWLGAEGTRPRGTRPRGTRLQDQVRPEIEPGREHPGEESPGSGEEVK
ncbi:MAG: GAF domain-containing protein, partial [Anaerolineae bacterium]|nr:GAF domain-containing protein [Anaerolineae bacterium]